MSSSAKGKNTTPKWAKLFDCNGDVYPLVPNLKRIPAYRSMMQASRRTKVKLKYAIPTK